MVRVAEGLAGAWALANNAILAHDGVRLTGAASVAVIRYRPDRDSVNRHKRPSMPVWLGEGVTRNMTGALLGYRRTDQPDPRQLYGAGRSGMTSYEPGPWREPGVCPV